MNRVWESAKDFFIPRLCPGCGQPVNTAGDRICISCFQSFERVPPQRNRQEFGQSFQSSGYISDYFCMFLFNNETPIAKTIHAFKYNSKFSLATYMGEILGKELLRTHLFNQIDLIIPMPLHTLRYAERGYNQSEMLAKGLSKVLGVPMSAKILKRIKNTPSQTGLNAVERQKNVSGAFRVVKPGVIIAKTVLLVDDVKTTGATMNECARVLMKQMPTKIHAISLAVAN